MNPNDTTEREKEIRKVGLEINNQEQRSISNAIHAPVLPLGPNNFTIANNSHGFPPGDLSFVNGYKSQNIGGHINFLQSSYPRPVGNSQVNLNPSKISHDLSSFC